MEYWLFGLARDPILDIHIREILWDSWAWGLKLNPRAITLEKFYSNKIWNLKTNKQTKEKKRKEKKTNLLPVTEKSKTDDWQIPRSRGRTVSTKPSTTTTPNVERLESPSEELTASSLSIDKPSGTSPRLPRSRSSHWRFCRIRTRWWGNVWLFNSVAEATEGPASQQANHGVISTTDALLEWTDPILCHHFSPVFHHASLRERGRIPPKFLTTLECDLRVVGRGFQP